jgi:hypothetical protein
MSKNNPKAMSETCIFHADLVSSMKTDEKLLTFFKNSIQNLDFDEEVLKLICDCCEINSLGFLEIYIEDEIIKAINSDEIVSLIKNLDLVIGGFSNNSEFSWSLEFPYSRRAWQKNGFEWELIHEETDDYYWDDDFETDWDE